jgi:hypothetical protein
VGNTVGVRVPLRAQLLRRVGSGRSLQDRLRIGSESVASPGATTSAPIVAAGSAVTGPIDSPAPGGRLVVARRWAAWAYSAGDTVT